MTYKDFIQTVYKRLSRLKFLILITGMAAAAAVFLYIKKTPKVFTSKATVFPLNATSENASAASALSSLLGLTETPKSFIQEASINIVDLALSRNTREAVALEKIPELNNQTVAELVIKEYNNTKPFFKPALVVPKDQTKLAAIAGNLLKDNFFAKINKNGILEINYSSTDESMVKPVSYIFVDKISAFYKELKIRKAKLDFDFMSEKVDSLDKVLSGYDKSAVAMSNTTMFVSPEKLQYQLPKENLASQKSRVTRQRDMSIDNREEALWRLQKVTPIIAILDKPDPPYETYRPSAFVYSIIGFFSAIFLVMFVLVVIPALKYLMSETKRAILSPNEK